MRILILSILPLKMSISFAFCFSTSFAFCLYQRHFKLHDVFYKHSLCLLLYLRVATLAFIITSYASCYYFLQLLCLNSCYYKQSMPILYAQLTKSFISMLNSIIIILVNLENIPLSFTSNSSRKNMLLPLPVKSISISRLLYILLSYSAIIISILLHCCFNFYYAASLNSFYNLAFISTTCFN